MRDHRSGNASLQQTKWAGPRFLPTERKADQRTLLLRRVDAGQFQVIACNGAGHVHEHGLRIVFGAAFRGALFMPGLRTRAAEGRSKKAKWEDLTTLPSVFALSRFTQKKRCAYCAGVVLLAAVAPPADFGVDR